MRWPAFMVDVETEWEWAGRHLTLCQTIPVVRAGKAVELGRQVRFACRGHYRLVAVRLACGFPLGLVQARHAMQHTGIAVHVLPKPQAMYWPLPWNVSPDPSGTLATRHTGQSFELGLLREYQQGDSVGRVNWRASARVGELVIQHFQQLGAVVLRVAVHAPAAPALGNPASAGEQAIRLAAGVFDAAQDTVHRHFCIWRAMASLCRALPWCARPWLRRSQQVLPSCAKPACAWLRWQGWAIRSRWSCRATWCRPTWQQRWQS